MTGTAVPTEVEEFRRLIARRLGLWFDDTKLGLLAEVLWKRLEAGKRTSVAYLSQLEEGGSREEVRALAQELTVPETYFFRNADQFRALAEAVVPDRVCARRSERRLRILSAGCASGEEPYSLAIVAREAVPDRAWDVSIDAIDVNAAMLGRAARGRYSEWALRETPQDMRRRWFRSEGREFVLDESVRTAVRFAECNLVGPGLDGLGTAAYDVVFCRNVLMYLTSQSAREVVGRLARALVPGGYLFLGHAETLRGLSHDFHLLHTHGTFYYQRKVDGSPAPTGPATAERGFSATVAAEVDAVVAVGDTWVETIRRATARIQALTDPPKQPARSADAAPRAGGASRWDLTGAVDLLRRERFAEALETVRALPEESSGDPDVLLLQAAILTQCGRLPEAEDACKRLHAIDELNAGAHFLLALCRESAGDRGAAADHDQVAVYLDPGFAMPRLHLGLLARRSGDLDGARRELGRALPMLQDEDPSRVLLFGGGFGREALVSLCKAEFAACGGTR